MRHLKKLTVLQMDEIDRAMNSITKPSFATCYYIRKLLHQDADELKSIVTQKVGFCVNSQATLEQLLRSVYLEDNIEQLLQRLYLEQIELYKNIRQLETLTVRHREIIAQNKLPAKELTEIERQIFWILGFKLVVVMIEDLVNALNRISRVSNKYLGTTLTFSKWQSTRPNVEWLNNFQINRSAEIAFLGSTAETISLVQLQSMQEWVTAFNHQVSQIVRDFAMIIERQKIGELPQGILLTRVNSHPSQHPVLPHEAR